MNKKNAALIGFLLGIAGVIFIRSQTSSEEIQPDSTAQQKTFSQTVTQTKSVTSPLQKNPYALFRMGNYKGAIDILREQYRNDASNLEVKKNLGTVLFAYGMWHLQQNLVEEADKYLQEALQLGHFDAQIALAGMTLHKGQVSNAIQLLDKLYSETKDLTVLRSLVDLSFAQDNVGAVEVYLEDFKKSMQRDIYKEDSDLKEFLEAREKKLKDRAALTEKEEKIEFRNVVVFHYFPQWSEKIAGMGETIEEIVYELADTFGLAELPNQLKLKIMLIPSSSFQNVSDAPPWAGGLFDGVVRIPVPIEKTAEFLKSRSLIRLMRHELTHGYLYYQCGDRIPSWMGEGLAERFEGRTRQNAIELLRRKYGNNRDQLFSSHPLEERFHQLHGDDVGIAYAKAFLLADRMWKQGVGERPNAWREVFHSFCRLGQLLPESLTQVFGTSSAPELWKKYGDLSEH